MGIDDIVWVGVYFAMVRDKQVVRVEMKKQASKHDGGLFQSNL